MQIFENKLIIPFSYVHTSGSTAIVANGNVQNTLTMAADCSFELLAILGSCSEDADTDIMPNNFSVLITDQSTGRNLASARVPQRCMAGSTNNGNLPEKYPIRFPASCILAFDFLNLTGNSNTVTIVLKGYKIYGTI